jgi:beta-1,4-mannosyltransferase
MEAIWITSVVAVSTLLVLALLLRQTRYQNISDELSVQVLVLGDVGRSPRIQYHAASIVQHGGTVDLIGYLGTYLPSGG